MTDLTPESLSGAERSPGTMYSSGQVALAAFLGGAPGGTWLMLRNFDETGETGKKKTALVAGVVLTIVVSIAALIAPSDLPNSIAPLITLALFGIWYHFGLDDKFRAHLEQGGQKASWWKTVGIGLAGGIAWMAVLVAISATFSLRPVNHYSDGSNVIYYEGEATREDAKSLADFLRDIHVFQSDTGLELTLVFPKDDPRRVIIALSLQNDIEGTGVEKYLEEVVTFIDNEQYVGKNAEMHVMNAFGIPREVIRPEADSDAAAGRAPYRDPLPGTGDER